MPTLAELELAIETAATDLAKIQALNALAKELRNTDTRRAKTLAEIALQCIGENQNYILEKANALLILGTCNYLTSNYNVALLQSKDARSLFEQANDKKSIASSLNNVGNVYFSLSDYPNALKHHQAALNIRGDIGDKQGFATSLTNIGNIYYTLSDYSEALTHHQESLSISRDINDKRGVATSLGNMGYVYYSLADYPNALKHIRDSLNINRDINDKKGIATSLCNLGNVYCSVADYPNALKYFQEGLNVFSDIGFKQGLASSLNNIGNVYYSLADYPNALKNQQESLSINNAIGNKRGMAFSHKDIGSTLIKMLHYEEAESHLLHALALCDDLGLKHLRFETLAFLAQLYADTKQFEKAYLTYIDYHNTKEAVFSEDNQKKLTNLQARFETEQAQKEAELYRLKNIDLAQANRFKMELLSLAAHDLKSPLQSIMGYAQLIQEADEIPQHIEKKAGAIILASQNMDRLIVDLLDTAAMEQGKLSVTKSIVDLTQLAKNIVAQYQPQASKKNQTIRFFADEPCVIQTDADKIHRILENLVSNAVKYSPEGKSIWVTVAEVRGNVQIAVRDEGQGLTEDDKEKLFQKFQRLSARPTGGENSTGLGLSIAKQLAELLGGSIRCDSAGRNHGATFTIDLPK